MPPANPTMTAPRTFETWRQQLADEHRRSKHAPGQYATCPECQQVRASGPSRLPPLTADETERNRAMLRLVMSAVMGSASTEAS